MAIPQFPTALRTTSLSLAIFLLANYSALPFCATAAKTSSRSLPNYLAYFREKPDWESPVRRIDRFESNSLGSSFRSLPFRLTHEIMKFMSLRKWEGIKCNVLGLRKIAFKRKALLFFSYSEAYVKNIPSFFSAIKTISSSFFNSSDAYFRFYPFIFTALSKKSLFYLS
jgi:hypothetical protein